MPNLAAHVNLLAESKIWDAEIKLYNVYSRIFQLRNYWMGLTPLKVLVKLLGVMKHTPNLSTPEECRRIKSSIL